MKKKVLVLVLTIVFFIPSQGQFSNTPPAKAAQSLVTALVFEKKLATSEAISVYVLGNSELETKLEQYLDQNIGSATLETVKGGSELPGTVPDVLFLGNKDMLEKAKEYCRNNKVLSVTNIPFLVEQGITLGIGIKDGQVQLILNPIATKAEGREWKSAIMKIAKVYRPD